MKAIELFAGAGGLGLGISAAGFEPVEIIERDSWCCETIIGNQRAGLADVAKWPTPLMRDVRKCDFSRHEGKVALVSGGPPCQPFSLGGRHQANLDERDMWPEAVKAVRQAKPKAFIFENVKGLTRQAFATYFSYVLLQLTYPEHLRKRDEPWVDHLRRIEAHHTSRPSRDGLTYNVVAELVNAADYGVPQKRERVVFVGFRSDLNIRWSFPTGTFSQDAMVLALQKGAAYWDFHKVARRYQVYPSEAAIKRAMANPEVAKFKPWKTVRDALRGLPDPETDPTSAQRWAGHRFQPGARSYPGHTGSPFDEPAKTLKAGVHGVPGGENMLVRPDGRVRYFSVRESARLQTFPDEFRFQGAWSEAMRQLGNAVPVGLAEVVAKSVGDKIRTKSARRDMP